MTSVTNPFKRKQLIIYRRQLIIRVRYKLQNSYLHENGMMRYNDISKNLKEEENSYKY